MFRPRPITSVALTLSRAVHIQPWLQALVCGTHANMPCPPMKSVLGPRKDTHISRNHPLGLAHHLQADRDWTMDGILREVLQV